MSGHVRKWNNGDSRFLKELSGAARGTPAQLSIRFTVDAYDDDPTSPAFTYGRIAGAIGLHCPPEPQHFVAGRALDPVPLSPLKSAYAQIRKGILYLDLSNSLPTEIAGGPPGLDSELYVAIAPLNRDPELLDLIPNYGDWYTRTAGIAAFHLTPDQEQRAATNPLAIVRTRKWGNEPLLKEASDGIFVRADDFVFRLNPEDTCNARLYATRFGKPTNQLISLAHHTYFPLSKTAQGPPAGAIPEVCKPPEALSFRSRVTTDDDGCVDVTLTASDPKKPRVYIDGQVYTIAYTAGDREPPPPTGYPVWSRMLNVLVFSGCQYEGKPTWLRDVHPIFQQYDNLYPVMRPIVDLSNYASVVGRLGILRKVFDAPISDPNYMPVSRDLSRAKREMICRWLAEPLYMRLDSKDDLIQALRLAVELEHSTIPPYLCALYSIKEGTNVAVAEILREVVMQEMVHVAWISNLLVALGSGPSMDDPSFAPRYPGPLPGGLRAGLTVRLRCCSIAQIRDVFMSMEEPQPKIVRVPGTPKNRLQPRNHYTIGWFYAEIEKALKKLSGARRIAFGRVNRQLPRWPGPPKVAGAGDLTISNLQQAIAALRAIRDQGESSKPFAPSESGDEVGHYYRFQEIVEGRRIANRPKAQKPSFTGDPIPFDPNGVWPMIDDPDITRYPPDSRAFILSRQFAETYQALLKALHRTFNDTPTHLDEAIGLMYSLDLEARELMQTPSGIVEGTTAGPAFQLIDL